MKTVFIEDLRPGKEVVEFFVLRKQEIRDTVDGKRFLKLELGDRTGRIDGVVWDNADQIYTKAQTGDVVKVRAQVTTYREMPQLKVERLRKAKEGEIDLSDFLPASETDLDSLFDRFRKVASTEESWSCF